MALRTLLPIHFRLFFTITLVLMTLIVSACQQEAPESDPEQLQFQQDLTKSMEVQSSRDLPSFFTVEEVAEHATTDDCWVIVTTRVYDLSEAELELADDADLTSYCGQDATSVLGNAEFHEGLAAYYVGNLVE